MFYTKPEDNIKILVLIYLGKVVVAHKTLNKLT
jgi:hypothetical protein